MEQVPIVFGTDGWRGVIAEDYTFANVRRCTQGFASYLAQHAGGDGPVVVGYDRRFASEHFADACAEVLAANGVEAMIAEKDEYTPTPVISHAIIIYNRGRKTGLADCMVITYSKRMSDRWENAFIEQEIIISYSRKVII